MKILTMILMGLWLAVMGASSEETWMVVAAGGFLSAAMFEFNGATRESAAWRELHDRTPRVWTWEDEARKRFMANDDLIEALLEFEKRIDYALKVGRADPKDPFSPITGAFVAPAKPKPKLHFTPDGKLVERCPTCVRGIEIVYEKGGGYFTCSRCGTVSNVARKPVVKKTSWHSTGFETAKQVGGAMGPAFDYAGRETLRALDHIGGSLDHIGGWMGGRR